MWRPVKSKLQTLQEHITIEAPSVWRIITGRVAEHLVWPAPLFDESGKISNCSLDDGGKNSIDNITFLFSNLNHLEDDWTKSCERIWIWLPKVFCVLSSSCLRLYKCLTLSESYEISTLDDYSCGNFVLAYLWCCTLQRAPSSHSVSLSDVV